MRSPSTASLHLLHVVVVCPLPQHVLREMQSSVEFHHPIIIIEKKREILLSKLEKCAEMLEV